MTPERAAAVVRAWVRLYTRGLPPAVAERRVEEIAADLDDQVAHDRAAGAGNRRIALALDSVGAKRSAQWIRSMIADPQATMPGVAMPRARLTEAQRDLVVRYLASRGRRCDLAA